MGTGLFLFVGLLMQLEKMIIEGVTQRVQRAFRLPSPPSFISTSDRWHLADRIQGQTKGNATSNQGTLTLPQAFLRLTTLATNQESYNAASLALMGAYGAKKQGSSVVTRYRLQPASFSFELIHISQDFFDMFRFARDYALHTLKRDDLNFTINYDGIGLDVRVMTDDTVTTPDKDASVDAVNIYELTANLTVKGWISPDLDQATHTPVVQRVSHDLIPTLTPPVV